MIDKNLINKFNTLSQFEKKDLLPAVLSEIVFSKIFYSNNKELKNFTKNILKVEYKDYLFHSRTNLYARIVRDFYFKQEDCDFLVQQISSFLKSYMNETNNKSKRENLKQNKRKSTQKDVLEGWRKIINDKG